MNITKELKMVVALQIGISAQTKGDWKEELEECTLKELNLLTEDIEESIRFLEEDSTGVEYAFLAELLPELIKRTQDRRLIDCFARLEEKHMNEYYLFEVYSMIAEAEKQLI